MLQSAPFYCAWDGASKTLNLLLNHNPCCTPETLKREITVKSGKEANEGGVGATGPLLHCLRIPWEGGKRKDGKALCDFLSFCLHTSPSACINSLPSGGAELAFKQSPVKRCHLYICLHEVVIWSAVALNCMRTLKGTERKDGTT